MLSLKRVLQAAVLTVGLALAISPLTAMAGHHGKNHHFHKQHHVVKVHHGHKFHHHKVYRPTVYHPYVIYPDYVYDPWYHHPGCLNSYRGLPYGIR